MNTATFPLGKNDPLNGDVPTENVRPEIEYDSENSGGPPCDNALVTWFVPELNSRVPAATSPCVFNNANTS
jgi:hypothetical protein